MSVSEETNRNKDCPDENILAFAKEISGGDPSAVPVLRKAVQQGFDSVEEEYGAELPGVSYQTLQNVMNGFDKWEEAGKA